MHKSAGYRALDEFLAAEPRAPVLMKCKCLSHLRRACRACRGRPGRGDKFLLRTGLEEYAARPLPALRDRGVRLAASFSG